jgi:transposase-like protein
MTKKSENLVGRPSKFLSVKDKIIEAIRRGNYYEPACKAAGVDYSTFRDWMKKAEEDQKGPFFQFSLEVQKAEAEAELEVVQIWKDQMPQNWQAAKEFLARRHPKSWASQNKVDVTSNEQTIGKPIFLPLKDNDQ